MPDARPSTPTLQRLSVLRELLTGDEHYGLELIRATGLPGGTLYPLLGRLVEEGWVTDRWEELDESLAGRPKRRFYRLTDQGRVHAREALTAAAGAVRLPEEGT